MWLSLHTHKRLEFDLFAQCFPRDIAEDYELDVEESATRPPLNFGEAAIVLPGTGCNIPDFYVNQKYELFKIFPIIV